MIARRELPHPGAQLNFTDVDGYRQQVFVTDLPDPDICYLEALFRGRGRVECGIRDAKDTGLANLPSHSFAINAAWIATVMIACELLAWTKKLCLDGELAKAEPKGLRHTLFHAAGLSVCSARRKSVRIASGWPWADDPCRRLRAAALTGDRHLNHIVLARTSRIVAFYERALERVTNPTHGSEGLSRIRQRSSRYPNARSRKPRTFELPPHSIRWELLKGPGYVWAKC
jgi:hypothetical protein